MTVMMLRVAADLKRPLDVKSQPMDVEARGA
jgi:hypothetical protein